MIALVAALALVLITACSGSQGSSGAKEKTHAETLDKVAGTWTAYSISYDGDERPEAAPIAIYQITIGKDFTVKSSTGETYTLIENVIGYSSNEWFSDKGLPKGEEINLALDVENDILEEHRFQNEQYAWTVSYKRASDADYTISGEFLGTWMADSVGWDGDKPAQVPTDGYTLTISADGTVDLSTGKTYKLAPYLPYGSAERTVYAVVDGLPSNYTAIFYFINDDGELTENYFHVDGTNWDVYSIRG